MKVCKHCNIQKSLDHFYIEYRNNLPRTICKDCHKIRNKKYYHDNKDKIIENCKKYVQKNIEKTRRYQNEFYKKRNKIRRDSEPEFKLKITLRNRLRDSLKGKYQSNSAIKNLGCSIEELKIYLESKFQPGMTWDNWNLYGWHLDHIIPLSHFNLLNEDERKIACHYTNLQPMWCKNNWSKGARYVG